MTGDDLGQETETHVVWPHLEVLWHSKDYTAGHCERKNKGRQKKMWDDNIADRPEVDFASSAGAADDRIRWKRVVLKSSVCPIDLARS